MAKLAEDLRTVLVDGVSDHLVLRNDRIVETPRGRAEQPAVFMDNIERRDHERNAALRPLREVRGLPLSGHAFVRKAREVRCRHRAIAELEHFPDLEGGEEMLELCDKVHSSQTLGACVLYPGYIGAHGRHMGIAGQDQEV